MSDYTVIPKALTQTFSKAGCPLSENQRLVLNGCLASLQTSISYMGLDRVIENYQKSVENEWYPELNKITHVGYNGKVLKLKPGCDPHAANADGDGPDMSQWEIVG